MYQVWTKDEYSDFWAYAPVDTLEEVETIIRKHFGTNTSVKVTKPIEYDARVTVRIDAPPEAEPLVESPEESPTEKEEEPDRETHESRPPEDQGTGGQSNKPVRRRH